MRGVRDRIEKLDAPEGDENLEREMLKMRVEVLRN